MVSLIFYDSKMTTFGLWTVVYKLLQTNLGFQYGLRFQHSGMSEWDLANPFQKTAINRLDSTCLVFQ